MAVDCIVRTERGWASFDWSRGLHVSGFPKGRNLDEITAEERKKLLELKTELQKLLRRKEILEAKVAQKEEILQDLFEVSHPFAYR